LGSILQGGIAEIINLNMKSTCKRVGFLVLVLVPAPDCVSLAADRSKGKRNLITLPEAYAFSADEPKRNSIKKKSGQIYQNCTFRYSGNSVFTFVITIPIPYCVCDQLKNLQWHNVSKNKQKEK
jgi:hypothetical protein